METIEKTFCNICLSIISDENFVTTEEIIRDVIDVLLLQLSTRESNVPVICTTCSVKLFAAFNFKATCMDTEDCIFPYVDSQREAPVDLRDVYLKERGKEHLNGILEDERICRLCMQVVTCEFMPVEDVDADMLCRYIPEVNFGSTKDPVICKICIDSLSIHTSFLTNCLNVKEKINVCCNDAVENLSSIKCEGVEIKSEGNYSDTPPADVPVKTTNNGKSMLKGKRKQKQTYKCNSFEYQKNPNRKLPIHLLKRKYIPKEKMYKCDSCEYKTAYKHHIRRHQQTHKDFAHEEMYECDSCDYKTGIKTYLTQHQLRHRDIPEEQMYKCKSCDYKTVNRNCLSQHQLKHGDQMYKCDSCDYKTKNKYLFIRHQLRHKDIVQVFKCESCEYKTVYKNHIAQHLLIHKDISEDRMYKCDFCDYKTDRKSSLTRHKAKTRRHP